MRRNSAEISRQQKRYARVSETSFPPKRLIPQILNRAHRYIGIATVAGVYTIYETL